MAHAGQGLELCVAQSLGRQQAPPFAQGTFVCRDIALLTYEVLSSLGAGEMFQVFDELCRIVFGT